MASGALTGSKWESKLRYLRYDARGDVDHRSDNRNLEEMQKYCRFSSSSDPDALKVKSVRVFANKLKYDGFLRQFCCCCYKPFKGMLKHHFVEIEAQSGEFFTLEKVPEVILFQMSPAPSSSFPVVRVKTDRKQRVPALETLQRVVEDDRPKDVSVDDVITWIGTSAQLNDAYDVGGSNCQHFAMALWSQLSEKPYPPPTRFDQPIATINRGNTSPKVADLSGKMGMVRIPKILILKA